MMYCALWGGGGVVPDGDPVDFASHRTGGRYAATREALDRILTLAPIGKALLTTWLVTQRRSGESAPLITLDVINKTLPNMRPLPYTTRFDRFLNF